MGGIVGGGLLRAPCTSGGLFNGPSLAKPWPLDGQLVGGEVQSLSPTVGAVQPPKIKYPPSKRGLEGPLGTHLHNPKHGPWSKHDGFTIW